MPMHPGTRLVQLALKSFGYDPGPVDSWFGPKTERAGNAFLSAGPIKSSQWALETLRRGLVDLGYLRQAHTTSLDDVTRDALRAFITAGGLPKASVAPSSDVRLTTKPQLAPVPHGRVIMQGGKVIDHFMLHTTATPGSWAFGKTNREMLESVRHMHTAPISRGGRGWSNMGYHYFICPDGEILEGRPITQTGAGAIGYNAGVCHASMVPVRTIHAMGRPEDFYTPETLQSMRGLIERVSDLTPIRRLSGHNEVAAKLCPGFIVVDQEWTDRAVI